MDFLLRKIFRRFPFEPGGEGVGEDEDVFADEVVAIQSVERSRSGREG
jgi:hypothetical protein